MMMNFFKLYSNFNYQNFLFANYEKNRAIEINDAIDVINTDDYMHYLLTIGSEDSINQTERIAQEERELRYKCDSLIVKKNRDNFLINDFEQVRTEFNFESQKALFNFTNAVCAKNELENKIQQIKKENEKLITVSMK